MWVWGELCGSRGVWKGAHDVPESTRGSETDGVYKNGQKVSRRHLRTVLRRISVRIVSKTPEEGDLKRGTPGKGRREDTNRVTGHEFVSHS